MLLKKLIKLWVLCFLCTADIACTQKNIEQNKKKPLEQSTENNLTINKMKELEEKLINLGFEGLLLYGPQDELYSVWQSGNNKSILLEIIGSTKSSLLGKFLAAETLRYFEVNLPTQHHKKLAEAYTYALKNTDRGKENYISITGNLWGFLYERDDSGTLGEQLIKFREHAVPFLIELLEDEGNRILYEGSKEATVGNAYRYRVKDFAVFYLSKITDIPFEYRNEWEDRDAEIEKFKKKLAAKGY